jgi:hypothetical protein
VIPLYGFVEGDTLGLLVLANESDTVAEVADRLRASAAVRVVFGPGGHVVWRGRRLEPGVSVKQAGLAPLDRVDLVRE